MKSARALVYARFSIDTFSEWALAQPFRLLCYNGEINWLRGNIKHMRASEAPMKSDRFGADFAYVLPTIQVGGSDSMVLDNALELLYHSGRSLPYSMLLLPEAWEQNPRLSDQKRAFYEHHSNLINPWDGPATLPFTDGRFVGALLDRNGLLPSRYTLTKGGIALLASEAEGVSRNRTWCSNSDCSQVACF